MLTLRLRGGLCHPRSWSTPSTTRFTATWDEAVLLVSRRANGTVVVDDVAIRRIDHSLTEWRQGDCVLGEHWFLFRLTPAAPLTVDAVAAAAQDADAAESEVRGLMVATQTCDLIRTSADRPFAEVCPLVEVDSDVIEEIRKGRRPRYAFVPGLADALLVADLDRTMTVEKAVIASWKRTPGCRDDGENRRLSLALARKRARAAFPDDFVDFASELRQRISAKHDRHTDEGRALRALREIRVRAAPSWNAEEVELTFWFIREEDEPAGDGSEWHDYLDKWLRLVPAHGRFVSVNGIILTLDDLTAREYVETDPLDLDHLTIPPINAS